MPADLRRSAAAEAIGTAFLLVAVVGSGIMGDRLAGEDVAMALLASSIATGCALAGLIVVFGSISGAHFNPAVTLAEAYQRGIRWRLVPAYILAQVAGAFAGVMIAHVMFGEPLLAASHHARAGLPQLVSEFVATFGLVVVIWGSAWRRPATTPFLVGAYITAAYWFTSSTSFANPAVTLARAATDTFAGIAPASVPGFVLAQLLGAGTALALVRWLVPLPICPVVHEACPFASGPADSAQPRVYTVRMLTADEAAGIDSPAGRPQR